MAFNLDDGDGLIEIVCSKDEAVTCDRAGYEDYSKTLDESYLKLTGDVQPTRFVLKKVIGYEEQKKIRNNQLGFKDGDVQIKMGYMVEEIRYRMVDIKNPGKGMEFKKDPDGYVSKSLIEKLDSYGIVKELHDAATAALAKKQEVSKKNLLPSSN
jgi:hypothetical protein